MNVSIPGYPCIGEKRQLKFLIEDYLAGRISEEELKTGSQAIRQGIWQELSVRGIDGIPSNDFTWYDAMLDTALLFDIVPAAFREAGLEGTELLFALARGYQKNGIDLAALPMKKWFDTNYHYIVPRIEADTTPALVGTKIIDEYLEAKALCIETRPRLIGPYTFLRLCSYREGVDREKLTVKLSDAYCTLLDRLSRAGVREVQLDEPALVLDMDEGDTALFTWLWTPLSKRAARPALLLQTMYGDVRDAWQALCTIKIEALGLDFVAGEKTLDLVASTAWPRGRRLVAGIFDARSPWRDDERALQTLVDHLSTLGIPLTLGASASLAHLPLSLEGEEGLSKDLRERLSFAREKLTHMAAFALGQEKGNEHPEPFDGDSLAALSQIREHAQETISFKGEILERQPHRRERRAIQESFLNLPLLPTTSIGSFPQDREVHVLRRDFQKGHIDRSRYQGELLRLCAECIREQEELGLDVLVHGEFERTDMVEFFGRELDGFAFTGAGWVRSYGTRCVKPPIVVGPIRRRGPMTVDMAVYAQSLSKKPVKGMLTGPVTILNWSFPAKDRSRAQQALEIARAIREEVLDLERAGIRIIQIDEAALKEKLPLRRADWKSNYLDWAIPCFRLCHAQLRPETQIHTHMCYSEFDGIIEAIDAMDADVISFEAARSDLSILDSLKKAGFKTAVGPGLWDIHSPRAPPVKEMEEILWKILSVLPKDAIWVNPDCGLKTRMRQEAREGLENLVEAAGRVRRALAGENRTHSAVALSVGAD